MLCSYLHVSLPQPATKDFSYGYTCYVFEKIIIFVVGHGYNIVLVHCIVFSTICLSRLKLKSLHLLMHFTLYIYVAPPLFTKFPNFEEYAFHIRTYMSVFRLLPRPQAEDSAPIRKVYYVSSHRDLDKIDWNLEFKGHPINLPVRS